MGIGQRMGRDGSGGKERKWEAGVNKAANGQSEEGEPGIHTQK